jgi:Ca-activated chloride channel family protein
LPNWKKRWGIIKSYRFIYHQNSINDLIKKITSYLLFLIFTFIAIGAWSQSQPVKDKDEPTTRILFVFDASQSMYGRWQSDMKILIAQRLLSNLLDSLQNIDNLELALRVYGHQKPYPPQDCDDTKLEVPFGVNNIAKIKHRLKSLNPKGTTPISFALDQARHDFVKCENCRNIIVLITDGIEECGGDPCEVSLSLQKEGISLKPFVIGIGNDFSEAFDCVGSYYDATSESAFSKALNVVISQALNKTTAQINLLNENDRPVGTNVNMTFYDNLSGKMKYNFVHTMNNMGVPDTLVIDPLLNYDIVVHTIPPVRKDSIVLNPGGHTIVPIKTPQGFIDLEIGGSWRTIRNLQAIVRQRGKTETLNVQNFGQSEKYLTGIYNIEVLSLPRIMIDSVVVRQGHTTKVEIPLPGIAIIKRDIDGFGSLYLEEQDQLQLIYSLPISKNKTENLVLQPGRYRVIFRSKFADKSIYTIEESFEIEPGKTVEIKLSR